MARRYKTIVDGSTLVALQWGAVDQNAGDRTWASGTITIFDSTGKSIVLQDVARVSVDGATLSWVPSGMPSSDKLAFYKVRWHGIDNSGANWYSRPLIDWTIEPRVVLQESDDSLLWNTEPLTWSGDFVT